MNFQFIFPVASGGGSFGRRRLRFSRSRGNVRFGRYYKVSLVTNTNDNASLVNARRLMLACVLTPMLRLFKTEPH